MKFYTFATIGNYIAFSGYTAKLAKAIQWAEDIKATRTKDLQVAVINTATGEVMYEGQVIIYPYYYNNYNGQVIKSLKHRQEILL